MYTLKDFLLKELHKECPPLPRGKSVEDAALLIEVGTSSAEWASSTAYRFTNKFPYKIAGCRHYYTWFLSHRGFKFCSRCSLVKYIKDFGLSSGSSDGMSNICKYCNRDKCRDYQKANRDKCRANSRDHYYRSKQEYRASKAKYRASKLKATPVWSELVLIKDFYVNCPEGYHVDHEVPLQGELVCGLHVIANLQYLTESENLSKGNKFKVL